MKKKKAVTFLLSALLVLAACGSGQAQVELNIPASFIGEQTQEDLDKLADEEGFQSIVLNADGSATYTMTQEQHESLLEEYREQIRSSLDEMIGSESYPNFTKIETNRDFTEFTITTKSEELGWNESFSVLAFYTYGGLYGVFSGAEPDNISVTFVNEASGEVLQTANSSDMQNGE
ncbi:MAG: hypothetical protein NC079_09440 [Clostridium sp.]|nr:hypothetical protein [Acetatifactor muris]MCM1527574.1 hypothetical protein [Bacteroides sp.]MCM1563815.1 hypothetical protein [Clostridium sp.]